MNFEAPKYQDHHEVKSKLIDPFAREINYLRLSVTDRCDWAITTFCSITVPLPISVSKEKKTVSGEFN